MTRKTITDIEGMIRRLRSRTNLNLSYNHAYGNQYRLVLEDQGQRDIGPVYAGIGDFYYALYGMASLLDTIAYEGKGVQK